MAATDYKECNCGWLDISTAPKDGTRVLVSSPRTGRNQAWIGIAWWNTNPQVWERDIDACWTVFTPEDFYYSVHLLDEETPTHWMPLPPPPPRVDAK